MDSAEKKKMHVTLVRGPIVSTTKAVNNESTPCIGLAYIAAYIRRQGFEVAIVDAIGEGLNHYWALDRYPGYIAQGLQFHQIIDRIPTYTDVIGFSAMFSGEWPIQRDLILEVRDKLPTPIFVAGGEHITALTEYSLRDCKALDVCVRGEGEHVFYELLECLSNDRDYTKVNGIGYLDDVNHFHLNENQPRIREMENIPWPYWPEGYLEKFWEAGKSYGVCSERDMPLMVSRGCPFQCTFCSSPQMWTTLYKLRDPDDVIAEIKSYKERYNVTSLQLYDLTAITKKSWTIDFCNKLLQHKINLNWSLPSGTRSEALDHESLRLIKQSGCNYLAYAPESGSPRTLSKIKKKIKLPRLTESVLEAKRQGLVLRTNLIIGFPHETRYDVYLTIKYGLKLAIHGVDEVNINIFSPYPGTEIYNELQQGGSIILNDSYLFGLTSLNSDFTQTNLLTFNPHMGTRELAYYRILFMLMNYAIGYLFYPSRILRTVKNVFLASHSAVTVFEHRLKDMLNRRVIYSKK